MLDWWFSWSGCAVGWTRPCTPTTGLQFWLFKEPQNRDFYHLGFDINSWEAKLFTSGCRSGNGKPNFSDTPKWMLQCFGSAPLCLTGIHPDRAGSRLASANRQDSDWLFTWTHKPLPQYFNKLPPKRAPPPLVRIAKINRLCCVLLLSYDVSHCDALVLSPLDSKSQMKV